MIIHLISYIHESDFLDPGIPSNGISRVSPEMWRLRHAVRGIFLNSKGEIPIIYATKDGYYKLPGGGIEVDEDMLVALEREMMEEVGAVVSHLSALGIVIEFKSQSANLQISTVFTGRISHLSSPPHYTEQELLDGLTLLWCTPSQALELMISAKPTSYIGKCIRLRDIRILEFYLSSGRDLSYT